MIRRIKQLKIVSRKMGRKGGGMDCSLLAGASQKAKEGGVGETENPLQIVPLVI